MSKELESKEKAEKELPRVLVICFDNSEEGEGIHIVKNHPFIKGDHVEVVSVKSPLGQSAKDWLSGFARPKLEELASFCAQKILAKTAVSPIWLSSPEIARASKDVSISGIVFEYEAANALRIKDSNAFEVSSFPKNEFLDLLAKNLA